MATVVHMYGFSLQSRGDIQMKQFPSVHLIHQYWYPWVRGVSPRGLIVCAGAL